MKSRIGKLEGDGRTAKRLQESMGKHIKILEHALKRERDLAKKLRAGESPEDKSAQNGQDTADTKEASSRLRQRSASGADFVHKAAVSPSKAFGLELNESGEKGHDDPRQDNERDKSRIFLEKCVSEATYHIIPSAVAHHTLAEEQELLQNHQYSNQVPQPSYEEIYAQQRQKEQNHVPAMPNHQPPPVPRGAETQSLERSQPAQQAPFMARSHPESHILNQNGPITSIDTRAQQRQSYFPSGGISDDQVEKVSHSYDAYGHQIPTREEEETTRISHEAESQDNDGWNFDVDTEQINKQARPPEYAPQRPDIDAFPNAHDVPLKSPPHGPASRRKSSLSRRRQSDGSHELRELSLGQSSDSYRGGSTTTFKVRFALRGHLDVVRSVIFSGGGTPSEPEICSTGDDGVIKRWIIPASYGTFGAQSAASNNDLDISSYFTHRGHSGSVMCLAAAPASRDFLNGGRALGDGWVFSGGQDATVRVWERGRVDPKATLDGHTDAIWTICVLPGTSSSVLGDQNARNSGAERMILASGSADGTIIVWAVSSPPQLTSPSAGSRRGAGGSRRANSVSSGSNFPSSPQPSTATAIPFHYSLVHRIERVDHPSPTCISPLSSNGENFVVSYNDASVLIYDTRTAEEILGMASLETYDGTPATGVNAVAATTIGLDRGDPNRGPSSDEEHVHGATGSSRRIEGMVFSGHEDPYIRFFDANSGELIASLHSQALLMVTHRSMHLHHDRSFLGHFRVIPVAQRQRARLCRPRRQHSFLVARNKKMHPAGGFPSPHARRGCMHRCLER